MSRQSRERRKVDPCKREAWNAYHREYRKRRKSLSQEQIGESFSDPDDGFLAFLMETETD